MFGGDHTHARGRRLWTAGFVTASAAWLILGAPPALGAAAFKPPVSVSARPGPAALVAADLNGEIEAVLACS